jgi:hypothetical protein
MHPRHLASRQALGYRWAGMNKLFLRIAASGSLLVLVCLFVGQRACDRSGYWPHSQQTRVYRGGDWPADQERKCAALPREDGTIYFLGCVDSIQNFDEATMTDVTFWGKTERPDRFQALHSESMDGWHWRCKKGRSSITCYAVN